MHTQTHVCGLLKETLVLGFVLVPGVNFLLNIFPYYLIFFIIFYFFAFLKNLNIKRVRIEPLED